MCDNINKNEINRKSGYQLLIKILQNVHNIILKIKILNKRTVFFLKLQHNKNNYPGR